ncbi:MAG: SCP2 sterol-binding domain-containing protein [Gammaproteobacteria bacterium]|nr:MAG: SCP2 sterol-binding domain-containing protein [Gammaproteobacteria bacterium]
MLAGFLFRPFEALLNRGIAQSTGAEALAAQLEGRTLALTIDATPFDLRLAVRGGRIGVCLPDGAAPDAVIRGTPLALGRLLGRDPQAAIRDGSVHISGDAEIAGQFEELLRQAAPDLEHEFSRLVGASLAQDIGAAARTVTGWGEEVGDDVARGIGRYLREDAKMVPGGDEIREFGRGVDEFVNDVERAEARIRQLQARAR